MASTTIRVSESLRDELEDRKHTDSESLNQLIGRLVQERDEYEDLLVEHQEKLNKRDEDFAELSGKIESVRREIEQLQP
jgi:chromosome segregation ATPase